MTSKSPPGNGAGAATAGNAGGDNVFAGLLIIAIIAGVHFH